MERIKSITEYQDMFDTEEKCWNYLVEKRWPDRFECPKCKCHEASFIQTRKLFQCKACRKQVSATSGTIFHGTRIALRLWFWAIFLLARHKKSVSTKQLQKDLDLKKYKTAWHMLHRIRSALSDPEGKYKLAGLVEIDEAYFGGKAHGKRGRGSEKKSIVEIAVENRDNYAGRAKMKVVDDASSNSLTPLVEEEVRKDSKVETDGWRGYNDLSLKGYNHEKKVISLSKTPSKVLPWVHTIIGNLKNWIRGIFSRVSRKHLQLYLDEYCYRLNRRWREKYMFGYMVRRCVQSKPLYYKRLVAD